MAAATTQGIAVRWVRENAFGTRAANPTYTPLRITGEDLAAGVEASPSDVLNSDGQIENLFQEDATGGGTLRGELMGGATAGEWDEFMQLAALSVDWVANATTGTTGNISATKRASGIPHRFSRTSGSWIDDGYKAGMWISVAGFTGADDVNNQFYKVVKVLALDIFVTGNANLVDTAAVAGITIAQLEEITNGTTVNTLHIEREQTDDTDEFHLYKGQGVNQFAIDIPLKGKITVEATTTGKTVTDNATTDADTLNAVLTTEPMQSSQVVNFYEGNPELGDNTNNDGLWDQNIGSLLKFALRWSGSLRPRGRVGVVGPDIKHGRGDIAVTGSLEFYYNQTQNRDDKLLFKKYTDQTPSAVAVVVRDSTNLAYVFEVSRCKFTNANRNAAGKNQDVVLAMDYRGYKNPDDVNDTNGATATGVTIRIARGTWTGS